jgi:glycosyltransferase 2 family protein
MDDISGDVRSAGSLRRSLANLDQTAIDALRGRFFVVPPGAPRHRRATDTTMLVLSSVVFLVFALRADDPPGALERAFSAVATNLPSFLDPLWRVGHDLVALWALFLVIAALFRRQWRLLASMAVAYAVVLGVGALTGRLINGVWPDLFEGPFSIHDDTLYPAVALATSVTVISVASAYVSRPYRSFGRTLLVIGALTWVTLESVTPSGAIGAVALGLLAASAVHQVAGSPAGIPSLENVRNVLLSMGVEATPHRIDRRNGVVMVRATSDDDGDLDVKIYGRDAWDGQLLVKLWRFFWYRDSGAALALSRLQQVEHEAFLTLLAERQGVPVDHVVTAGTNVIGDGVLVVRRKGPMLSEVEGELDDHQLATLWDALAQLHRAHIAHASIDPDHLRVHEHGVGIADLASGYVAKGETELLVDRAQMFVTTALSVGVDRAVDAARAALGDDGLADVAAFIQPAALSIALRRRCDALDVDIDGLRKSTHAALGIDERDLQKLRRVSVSGIVTSVIMFVAGYLLISQLTEVGIENIVNAMKDASIPILIAAFLVSSSGRVANAIGLEGISPTPVPLGRLTTLQFAQTFVNLAMPSTAGRVAVNIRFFQRNGVDPTTAVAMGALDGFTGFLCQLFILGGILLLGFGSLDMNLSTDFDVSKIESILLWLGVALVVGIIVIVAVPVLRNWVLDKVRRVKEFLLPFLKSPRRLAIAFGANMAAELIGALTHFTVLAAYGQTPGYINVLVVAIFVSLFAGLMPVPGGIGVTEAALTAGFIAIGVPDDIAFAAALTSRVITFYFPPVIGAFAFRSLRKQGFL